MSVLGKKILASLQDPLDIQDPTNLGLGNLSLDIGLPNGMSFNIKTHYDLLIDRWSCRRLNCCPKAPQETKIQ